ncbi:PspA/IM30 family protein [Ktedonospora formicarum]|uniref:Phage shock protein A n=1 Tax=Ktedonospora formicarum TaxID=2778364 RepID=A0A8J3I4F2_9CHLR|nr:PspA/IM30 family protein [Ktedonospora formicarum]GHO45244.1 hypothetical protein KSX_34070 [Ktedonospora formicarum]
MNLLERVLTLLRANLSVVVENADDPEKALKQLILDMRNQLVQVKTQVATAIAEGIKLQKRQQECQATAQTWVQKARQAVQQGNDEVARDALSRYNDLTRQATHFQQLKQEQDRLVTTLRVALRQLEEKIAEVQTSAEVLETRKRNALIQQRVLDALNNRPEQDANGRDAGQSASENNTNGSSESLPKRPKQPRQSDTDQLDANVPLHLTTSGELDLEKLKRLLNSD